jgi:hypothetical protein
VVPATQCSDLGRASFLGTLAHLVGIRILQPSPLLGIFEIFGPPISFFDRPARAGLEDAALIGG